MHAGAELLVSPVRRAIVDALATYRPDPDPETGVPPAGLTAAQIAEMLELHVTTIRFHLDLLSTAGIVESWFVRGSGAGRPKKMYAVAPGSLTDSGNSESLAVLAALLTDCFAAIGPHGPLTPTEAGEKWADEHVEAPADVSPATTPGRWLSKVGQMVDALHAWGYTPAVSTYDEGHTARIDLVRCPFIDLARSNPAVVCGIHRGLITGSMVRLGETDTDISLEPFITPDTCRAHVTTHTPFHPHPVPRRSTT